uniref:thiolase family protein n=1 Tax=Diaphorobacter sp. TaxID=1934310 RepID=UPI0025909F75
MTHREVFVVSTARTAIGTFGGSLKDVPNTQLATTAVKAAIARAGIAPDAVGHVVMGNVIPTDTKDAYLSRVAAIDAGCPIETPAFNVNRLCGSGLQAIVSAAQAIGYGDCDVAVGGGSESMSRGPYFDQGARWGQRMGDSKSIDYMLGILHDPWQKMHMGITAENVAERYQISREMQDQLALASQQRAAAAIAAGYFKEQIVTRMVRVLRDCGALAVILPELDRLFGVPQPAKHHPEIDTGEHVLMVIDHAAAAGEPLAVRWASLLHDLGKGDTPAHLLPHHYGHEVASARRAREVSERLKAPADCRDLAEMVAREHGILARAAELRAETMVKLIERCDGLRRPQRFLLMLQAAACDHAGRGRGAENASEWRPLSRWQAALQAVRAVDAG